MYAICTDKQKDLILIKFVLPDSFLGLIVIAEGVETEAQRDVLIDLGCNWVQGYLYSKPMDVDQFEKMLKGV